jgi:D-inositol-3-phosphate glycosyltransferase
VQEIKTICFINPHSDPLGRIGEPDTGGQCIVERELMKGLSLIDPRARLVSYTRRWGNKKKREEICPRAEVRRIHCGGPDFIRKEDMGDHLEEFCFNTRTDMLESDVRPDLFHSHYWDGGAAAVLLRKKFDVPLVHSSHSLGKIKQRELPDEKKYRYLVRIPWEERVYTQCERILALTDEEKMQVANLYGVPNQKIAVVPNGVDVSNFRPLGDKKRIKAKLGIDADLMVFTTGRVDRRKGFHLLLRAVPSVIQAIRRSGKSVLFFIPRGGRDLSSEERSVVKDLTDTISRENISDCVRLFPRLGDDDVVDYYNAADLFVCPSLYEPFGLVVIEAMACGTAVLATNRGGPKGIIRNGVDGLIVDPVDRSRFSEAVQKILLDDRLREKLAQEGHRTAVEKYSWRGIAHETMKQYAVARACLRSSHAPDSGS